MCVRRPDAKSGYDMRLVVLLATCILFGDGCGAVLVTARNDHGSCALMGMSMKSNGAGYEHLNARYQNSVGIKPLSHAAAASSLSAYGNIEMNGQEVYRWAVKGVPQASPSALLPIALWAILAFVSV